MAMYDILAPVDDSGQTIIVINIEAVGIKDYWFN
jgi:hypothetical protein